MLLLSHRVAAVPVQIEPNYSYSHFIRLVPLLIMLFMFIQSQLKLRDVNPLVIFLDLFCTLSSLLLNKLEEKKKKPLEEHKWVIVLLSAYGCSKFCVSIFLNQKSNPVVKKGERRDEESAESAALMSSILSDHVIYTLRCLQAYPNYQWPIARDLIS